MDKEGKAKINLFKSRIHFGRSPTARLPHQLSESLQLLLLTLCDRTQSSDHAPRFPDLLWDAPPNELSRIWSNLGMFRWGEGVIAA